MEPVHSNESKPISPLVHEIVADSQKLIRQEIAHAKNEIQGDWVRGKNALSLFTGASICWGVALGLGTLALSQALVAMGTSLGIAYALLSALFIGVGVAFYFLAKSWVHALTLPKKTWSFPPESTEKKENVEWLRKKSPLDTRLN